jgi:hypothetical protein
MIILRQIETQPAAAYQSTGGQLQTIAIIFITLNTLFVALRFYARHMTKAGLGWDDFFISAGYVSNVGLCITAIRAPSLHIAILVDRGRTDDPI